MTTAGERRLDLRDFQDIVDEARRLIPRYCPEWTDHNVSDPGITLVELFAWMTEMILYQVNRVPDNMYERFLDMIGVHRRPPEPAIAEVTMYLSGPLPRPVTVPADTEVATARTEHEDAIVFATTAPLTINPPTLVALRAWREGQGFENYLPYVTSGLVRAPMFNEDPQEGDALYVGYSGNLWGYSLRLRVECEELEGSHIDPRDPPLAWEYWSATLQEWAPVHLLDQSATGRRREATEIDPSQGLNRPADIYLHIPTDSRPQRIDDVEATWIRVRYVEKEGQGYTHSPRLSGLRSDAIGATVPARQARFVEHEYLGQSDGNPAQAFGLPASPVLRRERPHLIEARLGDDVLEWQEVEDFSESDENDRHFTVGYRNGEVRFGPAIRSRDGSMRQYGAIPVRGTLLRLRDYSSGGGTIGNVGEGTITQLKTSIPYIAAVTNYRPAAGGLNEESLEEAKLRSLSILKHSPVAVTREDYERLAEGVEGVGRACCLTPAQDESLAPGTVRLLLVPGLPPPEQELVPEDTLPTPTLVEAVTSFLDERKALGTLLLYGAVDFTWVEIDAHIFARRGADLEAARVEAVRRLREYLHPVLGRPGGRRWSFGASIAESQVAGLLQTMPEIAYVERVRLRERGDRKELPRVQAGANGMLALGHCYVLVEAMEQDV